MTRWLTIPLVCTAALVLLSSRDSRAQVSVCSDENLLAGLKPFKMYRVQRPERITDGAIPEDGGLWDTPNTAVLGGADAYADFDLGQITQVSAFVVQGDNNDTYEIGISHDGVEFTPAWTAPIDTRGHGVRTRLVRGLNLEGQYLRIGYGRGDGFYSVGEFQAFCQPPARWPPAMRVIKERKNADLVWTREHKLSVQKIVIGLLGVLFFLGLSWEEFRKEKWGPWVSPLAAAALCIVVGSFTAGVAGGLLTALACGLGYRWIRRRRRAGKPWQPQFERAGFIVLMVVGGLTWINFATFHGVRGVHLWDAMHYYMGSKYFKENRYERFYHCVALAEVDDGRKDEVLSRKYRDLKNNRLGPAAWILGDAEACRQHFTAERWAAFRQDVRLFREMMSPGWFKDAFKDHGYNATPVWNMIGTQISNWGWADRIPPAGFENTPDNLQDRTKSEKDAITKRFGEERAAMYSTVARLALIDGGLYLAAFLLILWAFGLRTAALATLMWGVGHPWAYYWTGGSFGRIPYFFMAVAGLCLVKKGYNALGGVAVTWSMLLRIFPGALAGGIALKILYEAIRKRSLTRAHLMMMIGAVLAIAILVPASLPSADGFHAYPEFWHNSIKHKSTPLTNHMGLPTLVSYDPRYAARQLKDGRDEDPFKKWKEVRREILGGRWFIQWGLVITLFAVIAYLARRQEDWEVVALSSVFIFALFELTCYYYNFLVLLAPVAITRLRYINAFLGLAIATQVAALVVGWIDERYVVDSALVFGFYGYILIDKLREMRRQEKAETQAIARG